MSPFKKSTLAALAFVASVAAHGHIDWLVADGVAYRGYDAPNFYYQPDHPDVIGWAEDAIDNGFVEPVAFGEPDIICHRNAKNAPGHATVKAGAKINLQWNTWPESHKGPVIDYLAKCPGNCEDVDKTELEFFKIGESGLIDMSLQNGYWADDVLMENNFQWTVQIPEDLASGNYVLRHELIALHGAGSVNGAQAYPQCFNLQVTGGGSLSPSGVRGTALYQSTDPGILFSLYTSPLTYSIPGPTLVPGLPSTVAQAVTTATATSSATVPNGNGGSGATSTSITSSSTTLLTTTLSTTTQAAATTTTTTTTVAPGGTVNKYGQCGGIGYTGPTTCATGSTCQEQNPYYSQCL